MILEADSIWVEFDNRVVLNNVYLKVQTNQITAMLGRNGCGKSTLFQTIFGSLQGGHQSVRFDGRYVESPFQENGLIRYLPQGSFLPKNMKLLKICTLYSVDFQRIIIYFPVFEKYETKSTNELSGGELRLFEVLLILFSDVNFVLLDEPFTYLSPVWIEQLKELILMEKPKKGILISDHQHRHVLDLTQDVYWLREGILRRLENPEEYF